MRTVVVTGTSTGIGYATAQVLIQEGMHVFGSVRRPADAERLRAELGTLFSPLLFDVTDQPAIEAAVEHVSRHLNGQMLFGLVNNAGVAFPGPLLHLPIEDFRRQLEVNLTAQLFVTQTFAPLLGTDETRKGSPGRIVMMSSVGGRSASPFVGAYSASKFGMEGMSEALRRELLMFGIDVVVIAPGAVATPIWEKVDLQDFGKLANTRYASALEDHERLRGGERPPWAAGRDHRPHRSDGAHDAAPADPLHGHTGTDQVVHRTVAAKTPGRSADRTTTGLEPTTMISAPAVQRVAEVRDDPEGRYRLRVGFYQKYGFAKDGGAGYGASELAFLRWEIERGVLNPLDHPAQPGSRWWRDVNDDFLLAAEQAADIAEGVATIEAPTAPVALLARLHSQSVTAVVVSRA